MYKMHGTYIKNRLWSFGKRVSFVYRRDGIIIDVPWHSLCSGGSINNHWIHIKVFYLPTDTQENCFKKNIKIYIKTALTCFGAITIIREHIIWAW